MEDESDNRRMKRLALRVLFILLVAVTVSAAVAKLYVFIGPVIDGYFNLQAELALIDGEIEKKSTGENLVKPILGDHGQIRLKEVHINNYEDQIFVRKMLSDSSVMLETPIFGPSEYFVELHIGRCTVGITHPGLPVIGKYYYDMDIESASRFSEFLYSVPGYR